MTTFNAATTIFLAKTALSLISLGEKLGRTFCVMLHSILWKRLSVLTRGYKHLELITSQLAEKTVGDRSTD